MPQIATAPQRFNPGDHVRVRREAPAGHVRTPAYIMDKTGAILRVHGAFRNPEAIAYGGDGLPAMPLYLVRFNQGEIWDSYSGPQNDTLSMDLFDHWLEPA